MTKLLLLSDIHGNYPALQSIVNLLPVTDFDMIINSGDSIVYGPFPNQVLKWLRKNRTISITGNTDKKVIKLLNGKTVDKPSDPDKRIMYRKTADILKTKNSRYLQGLPKFQYINIVQTLSSGARKNYRIGIFHGSPARHHEFLFATTPDTRFMELSRMCDCDIVITGHSHTPYHKFTGGVHFINPGSVGRMFDGDSRASCATLSIDQDRISCYHYRVAYDITQVTNAIQEQGLPLIYCSMYQLGKKLN